MLTLPDGIKAIIFDLDGTLVAFPGDDLLPHVKETIAHLKATYPALKYGVASNQGGVGLRAWMEDDHFGQPERYPTELATRQRVEHVLAQIGLEADVIMSFAYCSQKGKWAPTPREKQGVPEWSKEFRKPAPGMLDWLIKLWGYQPQQVLMVGDWNEDSTAAVNAGCQFMWANGFFTSDRTDEEVLKDLRDFDLGEE